jgi:hypothetical protein
MRGSEPAFYKSFDNQVFSRLLDDISLDKLSQLKLDDEFKQSIARVLGRLDELRVAALERNLKFSINDVPLIVLIKGWNLYDLAVREEKVNNVKKSFKGRVWVPFGNKDPLVEACGRIEAVDKGISAYRKAKSSPTWLEMEEWLDRQIAALRARRESS